MKQHGDEQSTMIFFIQLTKRKIRIEQKKRNSEIFILTEKSLINDSFVSISFLLYHFGNCSEIIKILFVGSSSTPRAAASGKNETP